jgi:cobalamin biosynthesis protein CbiG
MRSVQETGSNLIATESENAMNSLSSESLVSHKSYHELSDKTVVESDVLLQLTANVELLADLQSRFSFLMREVRYVLKV